MTVWDSSMLASRVMASWIASSGVLSYSSICWLHVGPHFAVTASQARRVITDDVVRLNLRRNTLHNTSLESMAGSQSRVQPVISRVTLADLPEIVAGDQVAFIDDYDLVEPEPRLPLSERLKHQIERYANLLSTANADKVQYLQARHPETGGLMGAAMWQCPGVWRHASRPNPGETGMGDKGSAWEGVDVGAWDAFIGDFDEGRKRHLVDKDHWYLGPIYTIPKFHRQGVASALIQHQIDLYPNDIMYLDARIKIAETYKKKGFRVVEGGKFYRMVRWPGGGDEPKRP